MNKLEEIKKDVKNVSIDMSTLGRIVSFFKRNESLGVDNVFTVFNLGEQALNSISLNLMSLVFSSFDDNSMSFTGDGKIFFDVLSKISGIEENRLLELNFTDFISFIKFLMEFNKNNENDKAIEKKKKQDKKEQDSLTELDSQNIKEMAMLLSA